MPKRETQAQSSTRSKKSQKHVQDPESQSFVNASSKEFSSDLAKDHLTNHLTSPQTNAPAVLSEGSAMNSEMDSSEPTLAEILTYASEGLPTKRPTVDDTFNQFPALAMSAAINSSGSSSKELQKKHPFRESGGTEAHRSFSITTATLQTFSNNPIYTLYQGLSPRIEDLSFLAGRYSVAVQRFAAFQVHKDDDITVDAEEIDRVQKIYDEFGQLDHHLPPPVITERLGSSSLRSSALEYIIHWALIQNISVDGDIDHTLLPPQVFTLYRALDRQSSDAHRILFHRWVDLTFGLLAGGYSEYVVSAEVAQRIDRIRRFLTNLIGPYRQENETFSEKLDEILDLAVAIGYHLMGMAYQYRWDWTWLEPESKVLGLLMVGEPPPRRPREEEVPEGIWIAAPALVREANDLGQKLRKEITVLEARQLPLKPFGFQDMLDNIERAKDPEIAKKLKDAVDRNVAELTRKDDVSLSG